MVIEYVDNGFEYLHGGKPSSPKSKEEVESKENVVNISDKNEGLVLESEWKANEDGSIPCPPESLGGCGRGILELRCIFSDDGPLDLKPGLPKLVKIAEQLASEPDSSSMHEVSGQLCPCFTPDGQVNLSSDHLRKAASRPDANDNYLYCPIARDIQLEDLAHFQSHWIKGEPVVVSNVLETASGLSWKPMVMWRAFRQIKNTKHSLQLDVTAIDCLDLSEVG